MATMHKVRIERLEQIEERLVVELQGITAQYTLDEYLSSVYVYGEVVSNSSDEHRHLKVLTSVYSSNGEVVGQGSKDVFIHRLVGFEPFGIEAHCSPGHGKPTHVRVYVKPSG